MIKNGILKGGERKEEAWNKTKLGEPFKDALERFRASIIGRTDFDPSSLLQFALFMSMAVINILKEAETEFGKKGQKMVIKALIKTGYDMGKQILKDIKIPSDISDIELISFLVTIVNTQAWTSIEDPRIDSEEQCSFDILWCPLDKIYSAFDCRVQRYLVQGILDAFRDSKLIKNDYNVEFKSTIPAGGKTCRFVITRKKTGETDQWEGYSNELENRALRQLKKE